VSPARDRCSRSALPSDRAPSPDDTSCIQSPVPHAGADDRVTIFPVRRWLGTGIAIQPEGQEVWYFWTYSRGEILTALSDARFEISLERPEAGRS
jgi:hypothetical protein